MDTKKISKVIGYIIGKLAIMFLASFLFVIVWNKIITEVCGFAELTYWQAFFLCMSLYLVNGAFVARTE